MVIIKGQVLDFIALQVQLPVLSLSKQNSSLCDVSIDRGSCFQNMRYWNKPILTNYICSNAIVFSVCVNVCEFVWICVNVCELVWIFVNVCEIVKDNKLRIY